MKNVSRRTLERLRGCRLHTPAKDSRSQRLHRIRWVWLPLSLGGIVLALITMARVSSRSYSEDRHVSRLPRPVVRTYAELLSLNAEDLGEVDLGLMNLLCAGGLPGSASSDTPAILAKLDEWAERVRSETERHLYRVTDPRYADHYGHSEARLRAEFLVQVLQEDCGVRYNEKRIRDVDFSRSRDLFIHGLLDPSNGGTCASMPVLYAAIGRRLGYPIKLVLAKQHIFCRWDGDRERFNIEGTATGGVDFFSDEHYRTWPAAITDVELLRGEYLVSLSPTEELGVFLVNRAACLRANARLAEARAALAEARRLMPKASVPVMALRNLSGNNVPGRGQRRLRHETAAAPQSVAGQVPPLATGRALGPP